MLKDLSLKQVNLVTTPCVVGRRGDENMRVDEIKGEKRDGQERRQMTRRWDDTGDEGNKHRIQVTSDEHDDMTDADWGGDSPTRRSVSAGVVMKGGHCLKVWAKRQQVMALSTAESELRAAVKSSSESLGIQSMAKDMGIKCWLNLHLDAASTLRLVNRLGLGKAKHVDMPNLRIQEVPKSGKFVTKNVRGQVNPADLMTKPPPRPQIEQLMKVM